jgi:hypothetical protein
VSFNVNVELPSKIGENPFPLLNENLANYKKILCSDAVSGSARSSSRTLRNFFAAFPVKSFKIPSQQMVRRYLQRREEINCTTIPSSTEETAIF